MRILDAAFVRSITSIHQRRGLPDREVCFVGRSNVGKSSLLNSLSTRKIARTGSTPGATRLINLYRVVLEEEGRRKEAVFSDFPGFGYSKVARSVYESWQGMIEGYMTGNEAIRQVLWAFDVRRDFDHLDDALLEWLEEHRLPFSLVLTKADKEGRGKSLQKKHVLQRIVGEKPIFVFSSKDGAGRKELLAHIAQSLG
jgi:GTP-binding protein